MIFGFLDFWIFGFLDFWVFGFLDFSAKSKNPRIQKSKTFWENLGKFWIFGFFQKINKKNNGNIWISHMWSYKSIVFPKVFFWIFHKNPKKSMEIQCFSITET